MDCHERHVTTLGPTLARPYSAKTAYSAGDWCLYGDWYYKCTVSIPVGEPWNPEHWERHEDILKDMPVDGFALQKVAPYLASATFSRTNFQDAKAWADTCEWGAAAGGCTAFGKGSRAYRWYDWTYDDACQTVVHTAGGYDSVHVHSVAGVAAMGLRLPETGAADNAALRFLPNRLVDGINDAHVFAEMNAVPVYGGEDPWSGDECPTPISIYECLSRFSTAAEAAAWLAEAVYTPPKYVEATGFTVHYLVKDLQETWIVEDGIARKVTGDASSNDYPAMTNFRCYAPDGSRPAPDPVDIYGDVAAYDAHGAGLERYLDAVDLCAGGGVSDEDVESLKYTLAYTLDESDSPLRPSDFVGTTVEGVEITTANCQDPEVLELIRGLIEYVEEHRERGDGTWQSVHVADYDLANLTFRVWVQEEFGKAYSFGLLAKAAEGVEGGSAPVQEGLRDVTDMRRWIRVCDDWTWTSSDANCPEEFLKAVNAGNAPKPVWHGDSGEWGNVNVFWPNGSVKYEMVLEEQPESVTSMDVTFLKCDEAGEHISGQSFSATATRPSATDTSLRPAGRYDNEFVRIATTDAVLNLTEGKLDSRGGTASGLKVDSSSGILRPVDPVPTITVHGTSAGDVKLMLTSGHTYLSDMYDILLGDGSTAPVQLRFTLSASGQNTYVSYLVTGAAYTTSSAFTIATSLSAFETDGAHYTPPSPLPYGIAGEVKDFGRADSTRIPVDLSFALESQEYRTAPFAAAEDLESLVQASGGTAEDLRCVSMYPDKLHIGRSDDGTEADELVFHDSCALVVDRGGSAARIGFMPSYPQGDYGTVEWMAPLSRVEALEDAVGDANAMLESALGPDTEDSEGSEGS